MGILLTKMCAVNRKIPVNAMAENFDQGITIDRMIIKNADFTTEAQYELAKQSHRDQGHTFHFVETGTIVIEIDFQTHHITAPAVVYMHPSQVHRILAFHNITVSALSIKSEELNPEYLVFLEDFVPAKPLAVTVQTSPVVLDLFSLCLDFSKQKHNRLHYSLLKDSCNTLVVFLISQFLGQTITAAKPSRFERVAKSFKMMLERNYRTSKRPSEYASKLNISTSYLNECIKHTTGFSVSQHIQDRIILEAKRLLYHTGQSVKEIAFDLGYDDYPYFSKLFTKVAGMSALAFRNKNRE